MYWVTGLLGFALALAPFAFGYSDNAVAFWTSLIIGGATIIVSWIEGMREGTEKWEYWMAGILGVVAILAPFALGFSAQTTEMLTSVAAGVLIALFAGSKLTSESQWRGT